jgi:hypothetical protein
MNRKALLAVLVVVIASTFVSGCSSSSKTVTPISVQLAPPPPASVEVSTPVQLAAQVVSDTAAAGVDWSVTCTSADCGSVSPAHTASGAATTYTGPATVPTGVSVTITAASTTDPTATASATTVITPLGSNASLTGQYAFVVTGVDANGFYSAAGSITADGLGNISGGEEDYANTLISSTMNSILGTYTVGSDGRGTITLNLSDPAVGVGGVQTLSVAFTNSVSTLVGETIVTTNQHALIMQVDSSATSSGTLDLQNSSAFGTGIPALGFVFANNGWDLSDSGETYFGGVAAADGAGNFTGNLDINDTGNSENDSLGAGVYSVALDGNGRGTLSVFPTIFGTPVELDYAFYMVGPEVYRFVELDANFVSGGSIYGAATTASAFDVTAVTGNFAFNDSGFGFNGPVGFAGQFTADGAGNLASGFSDSNEGTAIISNGAVTGTYAVPDGTMPRVLFTFATGNSGDLINFIGYLVDPTLNVLDPNNPIVGAGLLFLNNDTSNNGAGYVIEQSPATFGGNYAVNQQYDAQTALEIDAVGQGFSDGSSMINGNIDANTLGAPLPGLPLAITFAADPANVGRFTGTIALDGGATVAIVFYQASTTQVFDTEVDDIAVSNGYLIQQ